MTVFFLYMCVSQTATAVGEPAMSSFKDEVSL